MIIELRIGRESSEPRVLAHRFAVPNSEVEQQSHRHVEIWTRYNSKTLIVVCYRFCPENDKRRNSWSVIRALTPGEQYHTCRPPLYYPDTNDPIPVPDFLGSAPRRSATRVGDVYSFIYPWNTEPPTLAEKEVNAAIRKEAGVKRRRAAPRSEALF